MESSTLHRSSRLSASQLLSQIHELKEDLYRSHIEILNLKKKNKKLKQKLKDK